MSPSTSATTKPWSRLRRNGLLPFSAAVKADIPAVMVANAVVPGLTRLPASVSRAAVHRVLRTRLGFHGLVLPDSLTAAALRAAGFDLRHATVAALRVGNDMVLYNATADQVAATTDRVVHAVVEAVHAGRLSRARLVAAVGHVLRTKDVDLCGRRRVTQ